MPKQAKKHVKIKLVKGLSGLSERQRANIRGLGLRKRGSVSELILTPEVQGMINRVHFLLTVEEMTS